MLGALAAIAEGEEDKRKALLQGTMALNQPMIEMSNQNMQETMNNAAQNNGNTFVGIPTGYAAPIQFTGNAQPSQMNDNAVNNYFNENQPALPTEGSATEELNNKGKLTGFASGVNDFMNGFNENYNTAYTPENLQKDSNKGIMNRIGEAFGTTARIAQNPTVQGAVSGLVTGALTGNPFAGYAAFSDVARKKDMSRVYKDYLAQNGVKVNPGMFGNLTSTDMNNMAKLAETRAWHEYMNNKYQNDFEKYMQKLDETVRHNKAMEENSAKNADSRAKDAQTRADKQKNGTTITHVSTGGGKGTTGKGGNTAQSGKYVIMEAPNGKRYNVPVERIKEYKSYGGKIVG